jgi:hypothetical protein
MQQEIEHKQRAKMANTILRNINFQPEVYEVIQLECARRRNGGKGISLTLNQIVMEWLDGYNAGVLPVDPRHLEELKDMPAVEKVLAVPVETEAL